MSESNGFRIKSWSDVLAVIGILAMIAGAMAWGLKLDAESSVHERRISALEQEME